MADMKFSCSECGQHFSCGESWAGHQLECPTCHSFIMVPRVRAPSAAPVPAVPAGNAPKATGPKLPTGAAQTPRSTAHAPAPINLYRPPPPRSDSGLLKYGLLLVVVAALGGAGYFYGLPLLTGALEKEPGASPPAGAAASQSKGGRPGPMGEVNEAMDVSDALDGGSSPRPRPVSTTNTAARPRPAAPR